MDDKLGEESLDPIKVFKIIPIPRSGDLLAEERFMGGGVDFVKRLADGWDDGKEGADEDGKLPAGFEIWVLRNIFFDSSSWFGEGRNEEIGLRIFGDKLELFLEKFFI